MIEGMDRIAGIETEYGCLVAPPHVDKDFLPVQAVAPLLKNDRSGRTELHGQRNGQHHGRHQDQDQGREHQVA